MEELKKKYNLFTGIALVVGISIGSGIFIKAHSVLENTGGNLWLSLLAWFVGGMVMVISAYTFSFIASRVSKNNGAIDYFEASTNSKAAYYLGWYFTCLYYPILVSIVGYVTAGFFISLCGFTVSMEIRFVITLVFVIISFAMNIFSPKIAGYFQTSATIIKLIPIIFIALVGLGFGIFNNTFGEAFSQMDLGLASRSGVQNSFAKALIGTTFSYEGWIIATSINAEMKDSKKNLPKALVIGSIIVVVCYLVYNLGLSLIIGDSATIIELKEQAPILASQKIFGSVGPYLFNFFLLVSCLGTLNGLTIACIRGMYSLSVRNEGISPKKVSVLHPKYNISVLSGIIGFVLCLFFLGVWYLSFKGILPFSSIDELSVALVYFSYIFVYIYMMKNFKELNVFKRFVMPIIATIAAVFVMLASTGILDIAMNQSFTMFFDFLFFVLLVLVFFAVAFIIQRVNYRKKDKI